MMTIFKNSKTLLLFIANLKYPSNKKTETILQFVKYLSSFYLEYIALWNKMTIIVYTPFLILLESHYIYLFPPGRYPCQNSSLSIPYCSNVFSTAKT